MSKALLDTDMLSEIAKGVDRKVVSNAVFNRQSHAFLTLSVVSVMEVIQGYHWAGASTRIQAFRNATASEEILVFDKLPLI